MSNRELVINVANNLPEDAPLEDFIQRIEFIAGVQEGLAQAERGEGIPLDEVKEMIKSWTTK